jgi:hypothetical protein
MYFAFAFAGALSGERVKVVFKYLEASALEGSK